jgi:hypothetical protein
MKEVSVECVCNWFFTCIILCLKNNDASHINEECNSLDGDVKSSYTEVYCVQ